MAVWSPFIGESLNTQVEPRNVHDKYAVKVLKNEVVVGHVPREILRYCSFVLNSRGTMSATLNGSRENRRGNGLIVPCKYKLKASKTFLSKAGYIIRDIVSWRQTNLLKYYFINQNVLSFISPCAYNYNLGR